MLLLQQEKEFLKKKANPRSPSSAERRPDSRPGLRDKRDAEGSVLVAGRVIRNRSDPEWTS